MTLNALRVSHPARKLIVDADHSNLKILATSKIERTQMRRTAPTVACVRIVFEFDSSILHVARILRLEWSEWVIS